ncbi:MAG: hypothetical protein K6F50_00430 [Kiritimatiellae bacterium]|nr:hypothetical protein [Kiritimatiellia bacterium]
MKKLLIVTISTLCAVTVLAAPSRGRNRGKQAPVAEEDAPTTGKEAKILIDQFPKLGRQSTLPAPSVSGGSIVGKCYSKPRNWIVLEAKYSTFIPCQEQLTFTWHVMLDAKSATENKGNKEGLAPYSYFTTAVTYQNIPRGSHAASVCLHPSYLERYGEPKAVGLVVTNAKGEVLAGDCESEIKGLANHPKTLDDAFWNNDAIMNAKQGPKDPNPGDPMVERRQGLTDRSKTIWALVNPNDYEMVVQ